MSGEHPTGVDGSSADGPDVDESDVTGTDAVRLEADGEAAPERGRSRSDSAKFDRGRG